MFPKELFVPPQVRALNEFEKNHFANGCGSAQAKFDFVPDTIWGLDISDACNVHDLCYYVADPDIEQKKEADRVFLNNLNRLINIHTKFPILKWLRRRRAMKYYLAVKYFGGPAFWDGKNN